MEQQKTQLPPIYVDMTIGDESARLTKVKHQGFEETVRAINGVLKKMNAPVKLDIADVEAPLTFEIPDFPDMSGNNGGREKAVSTHDS